MKSTPPSAGSPRGAAAAARASLPRLSIPPPCSYESGAPLLISPRRLTGAFSPKVARNSSEFSSSSSASTTTNNATTTTTTNAGATTNAGPTSSTSSLSGRARRTTSESNEVRVSSFHVTNSRKTTECEREREGRERERNWCLFFFSRIVGRFSSLVPRILLGKRRF